MKRTSSHLNNLFIGNEERIYRHNNESQIILDYTYDNGNSESQFKHKSKSVKQNKVCLYLTSHFELTLGCKLRLGVTII